MRRSLSAEIIWRPFVCRNVIGPAGGSVWQQSCASFLLEPLLTINATSFCLQLRCLKGFYLYFYFSIFFFTMILLILPLWMFVYRKKIWHWLWKTDICSHFDSLKLTEALWCDRSCISTQPNWTDVWDKRQTSCSCIKKKSCKIRIIFVVLYILPPTPPKKEQTHYMSKMLHREPPDWCQMFD